MYKLVITDLDTNEEVVNTVSSVLIGAYKREEECSEQTVCSAHFDLWDAVPEDVWCIVDALYRVCAGTREKLVHDAIAYVKEHPDAEV